MIFAQTMMSEAIAKVSACNRAGKLASGMEGHLKQKNEVDKRCPSSLYPFIIHSQMHAFMHACIRMHAYMRIYFRAIHTHTFHTYAYLCINVHRKSILFLEGIQEGTDHRLFIFSSPIIRITDLYAVFSKREYDRVERERAFVQEV
jgi:hypothetical protein